MSDFFNSGMFITKGIKEQVVQAWLVQQQALGNASQDEVFSILVCQDNEERLRMLQALSDRIGDAAPIEILDGIVSGNEYP